VTRAMKIVFFLSAIAGIAVGGRLGYSEGAELSESMRTLEPIAAEHAVSDFAAREFRYADSEHARKASRLEISVLAQIMAATNDTGAKGQLGLAYIRLALVEKDAGNQEAERLALKQARALSPRPAGQELSDEQLEDLLKRLDRAGIGATRSPKTTNSADSPPHPSLE